MSIPCFGTLKYRESARQRGPARTRVPPWSSAAKPTRAVGIRSYLSPCGSGEHAPNRRRRSCDRMSTAVNLFVNSLSLIAQIAVLRCKLRAPGSRQRWTPATGTDIPKATSGIYAGLAATCACRCHRARTPEIAVERRLDSLSFMSVGRPIERSCPALSIRGVPGTGQRRPERPATARSSLAIAVTRW